jgi:MFS family permease
MNKRVLVVFLILLTAGGARAGVSPGGFHFEDQPGEWWRMKTAAQYGGWVGGGVGSLAGILGATAGLMVSRGKGRKFIVGAMMTLTVAGLGALLAGIVAALAGQPWHVKYPLLLMGSILSIVCGANTLMLRRLYGQVEMRQMVARDA